jgi:hypothetical protein
VALAPPSSCAAIASRIEEWGSMLSWRPLRLRVDVISAQHSAVVGGATDVRLQ